MRKLFTLVGIILLSLCASLISIIIQCELTLFTQICLIVQIVCGVIASICSFVNARYCE